MSEYEPILDSNNPLSLNRDNPGHGNYSILTAEFIAFPPIFLHNEVVTSIVFTGGFALTPSLSLLPS